MERYMHKAEYHVSHPYLVKYFSKFDKLPPAYETYEDIRQARARRDELKAAGCMAWMLTSCQQVEG